RSRYLIVICSSRAAKSRWVDEEVRHFKSINGEDRLLCLIVGGEPNTADKPGHEENECFPASVRFRLNADGSVGTTRTEPIAADGRPGGDGPRRAKLKIIAGVLGVNFDDLWRRDERRRFRRRVIAVFAAIAIVLGIFAGHQWEHQRETIVQFIGAGDLQLN